MLSLYVAALYARILQVHARSSHAKAIESIVLPDEYSAVHFFNRTTRTFVLDQIMVTDTEGFTVRLLRPLRNQKSEYIFTKSFFCLGPMFPVPGCFEADVPRSRLHVPCSLDFCWMFPVPGCF